MKFNLLDFFLPRETRFFSYMLDQAQCFVDAAHIFKDLVTNLDTLPEDQKKLKLLVIKELEQNADTIEKKIIDQLNQTFITPIDREDIHDLAVKIDRTIDILNNLAKKFDIYKIKKLPEKVNKFTDIILTIGQLMVQLMKEFDHSKNVETIQSQMHILENEADDLFSNCIAELFDSKVDPIDVIRFKDIYESMENIVDSVDYVGKIVRGIKVKQA